jgi:drug/metabolite transporter (DMT)-like permease
MSFWRSAFGGLFLSVGAACLLRGRLIPAIRSLGWPGWFMASVAAMGMIAFIGALKLTTVADVAIIYATLPFVSAALAWVWLRERIVSRTLLASIIAGVGVAIMVSGATLGGSLVGDLLAFLQTGTMAFAIVAVRRYRQVSVLVTICLGNAIACLVCWPFAMPLSVEPIGLVYLALFGFVQMALGGALFAIGSRLVPVAETALISALEAPFAPVWVWLAFGELPSLTTMVGGMLVFGAAFAHVLASSRAVWRSESASPSALEKVMD